MSGDRPHDDAFELDDELFSDDEFVLEFGDEDAEFDDWDGTTAASSGGPVDPIAFEQVIEGIDATGDDVDEAEALVEGARGEDQMVAPTEQITAETASGTPEMEPADLLFSDPRDDVSPQSAFGDVLGPTFGDRKSDYEVPDIGLEGEEQVAAARQQPDEAVELDVEFDDDGFDDDWQEEQKPVDLEQVESPAAAASGGDFDFDPWAEDDSVEAAAAVEEHDPIYGNVGSEQTAFDEAGAASAAALESVFGSYEGETDHAEYEEAYVDADDPAGQVVGGVQRRSPWRKVAAAAALVPIVAAGAIAFMKPEWLGVKSGVGGPHVAVVDRIPIERPRVEVRAEPAPVAFVAPEPVSIEAGPRVDPPVAVSEPIDPVAPADPIGPVEPVADPGTEVMPAVTPDPVAGVDPTATDPDSNDVDPGASEEPQLRYYPAGPNLLIARFGSDLAPVAPREANGLKPGAQAFARLQNGAFFTGTVRRVEATYIALDLEFGEVAFRYEDLESIVPLANADLTETSAQQHGYLRLTNSARLTGALRRNHTDDSVTLIEPGASITIPAGQIDRVGFQAPGKIDIVEDGEDDWLRSRVRERLKKR